MCDTINMEGLSHDHVTNHLIISNDKGLQHRKNRNDYMSDIQGVASVPGSLCLSLMMEIHHWRVF